MNSLEKSQDIKSEQTKRKGVLAIHSVDEFVYSVPDLEIAVKYYESFGLRVERETFNGKTTLGLYTDHHSHRWGRVLESGNKKRLQWITYGIYAEDLEPFRAHLKKSGVELIQSLDPESPPEQLSLIHI